MNFLRHVEQSIEKAGSCESNLTQDVLAIIGMCGEGNRHLYNNIVQGEEIRCLEIGTYQGASTSAILCNNKLHLVSIDFMSDMNIKEIFHQNVQKFKGDNDFTFLNDDCFKVNLNTLPMFNVYIYDGEHYEEDHYNALTYYLSKLESTFIYIVDDWNWEFVRKGTLRAIDDLDLKIVFQKELFSDVNESATPPKHGGCDARHWGNGCGVFVLQK